MRSGRNAVASCELAYDSDHREARLMRIDPVSQEMALNYIAQSVLGLPRSY